MAVDLDLLSHSAQAGEHLTVSRSRTGPNWLVGSFVSSRNRGIHFRKYLVIFWVPKYRCGREV